MSKKKILFYLAQEYYWPSMEPIYQAFKKDKNYDLSIYLDKNSKRYFYIFLISQQKKLERKYRDLGYKITSESKGFDAVFCGAPIKKPERFGEALLCNVDHGPGIKTLRYRHFLKQSNTKYLCFIEGQYRADKFKKYDLDKIEDIVDVGLPKLDRFFNGYFNAGEIFRSLNLDPDRQTVLYAPSYKPTSIFDIGRQIVALGDKYNIIVKLHPYSWSGKYASHAQHRLFEELQKKYSHFLLVRPEKHDIMPFMFIADTMISDGSSVINEFLALGRCGIIYDMDESKLKHGDGQQVLEDSGASWLKDSFIHIQDPEQISDAIEQALNPSIERLKKIKEDKEYIFSYTDGKSAERVKNKVDEVLSQRGE
ncbi:MAG: CDP-glycerol glycerophosphotransferase family protein [Calditrichaceae bacterium]|nr:CDP-glycerol glycerophosphotransferase family protein [Calditrichaceae bacterium]